MHHITCQISVSFPRAYFFETYAQLHFTTFLNNIWQYVIRQ